MIYSFDRVLHSLWGYFTGVEILATCDDVVHVFADGFDYTTASGSTTYTDFSTVEHHILPESTQVVGIQCENTAGSGALIASIANVAVTDTEHWRCSHTATGGWSQLGTACSLFDVLVRSFTGIS